MVYWREGDYGIVVRGALWLLERGTLWCERGRLWCTEWREGQCGLLERGRLCGTLVHERGIVVTGERDTVVYTRWREIVVSWREKT